MFNSELTADLTQIARLDQTIHTPARLLITALLYGCQSMEFINLMNLTELTWGNLSAHLSKLEDAGYIMITKTYKGKRPQTLINLTEAGRFAYLEWGRTVIKALPEPITKMRMTAPSVEAYQAEHFPAVTEKNLPINPSRELFFLPKYHRWAMDLPPIKEFSQLS